MQDRYGLSWQLSLGDVDDVGQKIVPFLTFTGDQHGHAEEAVNRYTSTLPQTHDAIANWLPESEYEKPDGQTTSSAMATILIRRLDGSGDSRTYAFCDVYRFSVFKDPKVKERTSYVIELEE